MRGEVRVKAYGLFEFTRSGYIRVQSVVIAITVILTILAFVWTPTGALATNPVFVYMEWLMLVVLVAEIAEASVMLGKFRAKSRTR